MPAGGGGGGGGGAGGGGSGSGGVAAGGASAGPGADNLPDSSIGEGMDITIQGANGHVKHSKAAVAASGGAAGASSQSVNADSQSLQSGESAAAATTTTASDGGPAGPQKQQPAMDTLRLPSLDCEKMGYSSDMSIGRGMDISIRGDGDLGNKECYEGESGWQGENGLQRASPAGGNGSAAAAEKSDYYDSKERIEYDDHHEKDEKVGSDHGEDDIISYGEPEINGMGKNVEEVLEDPIDDVVVEKCCPEVCYRMCPCCIGDPDSPFWQLWYKHRLQVSR